MIHNAEKAVSIMKAMGVLAMLSGFWLCLVPYTMSFALRGMFSFAPHFRSMAVASSAQNTELQSLKQSKLGVLLLNLGGPERLEVSYVILLHYDVVFS